ncbi:MAG: hypothetical protein KatS3mg084_0479 [Candidatus Dojkabacteria bacterium]|nr:MAG: hypothetical protein KatS3mg084_0479 [Candidatus Dojkabacteria bacterium]
MLRSVLSKLRNKIPGNLRDKILSKLHLYSTIVSGGIKPDIRRGTNEGLYGYIDNLTVDGISGWFVNLSDLNDKSLAVFINGIQVGEVTHFFYRQDVADIISKRVDSGFYVNWSDLNIDKDLFSNDDWRVNIVHLKTGKRIVGKYTITEEEKNKIKKNYSSSRVLIKNFVVPQKEGLKVCIDRVITSKNSIRLTGSVVHETKHINNVYIELGSRRFKAKYNIERFENGKSQKSGFVIDLKLHDVGEKPLRLVVDFGDNEFYKLDLGTVEHIKHKSNWSDCQELKNFDYILSRFRTPNKTKNEKLPETIDIIVPVFNAYGYLVNLFKTLLENTNEPYRLIIVDDASTDYRVRNLLREISEGRDNVILIRNEKNLGFVSSVNKGFSVAENHVVIVNTDVELPSGWLYRLVKPILEDNRVASVTPFTNAGTICSFPEFLKDNELPKNLDYDQIDDIFSSFVVDDCYIELPTGVGFCMGISKNALKDVGFFDEKTFERGYGEENDWCMRARQKGYKNILAPNLFVYHKHGGSFQKEEKLSLINQNLKRLSGLHSQYFELVNDFIDEEPNKIIRDTAFLLSVCKNIDTTFIIDHNIGGGANIYRNNLVKERLKENRVIILYTEDYSSSYSTLKVFYRDIEKEFFVWDSDFLFDRLQGFKIDEIILNNLVSFGRPLDLLGNIRMLKEKTSAKLVVNVHEFYLICPSYNLLNDKGKFCGVPEDINICRKCLKNNFFATNVECDVLLWRNKWSELMNIADHIVCFSDSSRDIVTKAYPTIPEDKFLVIPHRLDVRLRKVKIEPSKYQINLGVIGSINYQKGSKVISELAKYIDRMQLPVKLFIIGEVNMSDIEESVRKSIHIYGRYERQKLPDIVEELNIHVVFFSSIWPETFSFVVDEVVSMGLPIIIFDIGAPAERIKAYTKAKIVDINNMNVESLINAIKDLYNEVYGIKILS